MEEVAVFFDMRGKVQRVLAYQALGKLGIALFECLDDVHMIDDRARGPVALRDGHPADCADVNEQVLDGLAHEVRAGEADDRLVKRDVGVRILVDMLGRRRIAKLVEEPPQPGDIGIGRVLRREPR